MPAFLSRDGHVARHCPRPAERDEPGDADALPTSKLIRASKAAGRSGRFFTTLATNVMHSPDDAYELLLRPPQDTRRDERSASKCLADDLDALVVHRR